MTAPWRPRERGRRLGGAPAGVVLALVALAAGGEASADDIELPYARHFEAPEGWPRIAVVITGLGLSRAATSSAIRLPGGVTLGFSSHAPDLQKWIDLARAAGHEVILELPMEPMNYPEVDPGPNPLLTSLSRAENLERLQWHLDRATGYVGVTPNMGARFVASPDDLRPVLVALKTRGVMFLDAHATSQSAAAQLAPTIGLSRAISNRVLDAHASRTEIDKQLAAIARIARRAGAAVAVGHAFPVTLERLDEWLPTLAENGLALVPISGVVDRQLPP